MNENFNLVEETNVSNQVEATRVSNRPKCLNKFNLGAFALTFWWAIFNRQIGRFLLIFFLSCLLGVFLAAGVKEASAVISSLIALVVGLVFGVNGNRRAWEKNKGIMSAKEFDKKQAKWNKAGIVFGGVLCGFFVIMLIIIFIVNS